jgi:hypothetical protein
MHARAGRLFISTRGIHRGTVVGEAEVNLLVRYCMAILPKPTSPFNPNMLLVLLSQMQISADSALQLAKPKAELRLGDLLNDCTPHGLIGSRIVSGSDQAKSLPV